jgi:hypothetical protein
MRVKLCVTLVLMLLVAGGGLLAGEEPGAASTGTASAGAGLLNTPETIILFGEVEPNQTVAPGTFPKFRWSTTLETESGCPPPELTCVYYGTGDCLSCGPGKTAICHSYHCNPNYVLYTCCTCGLEVC